MFERSQFRVEGALNLGLKQLMSHLEALVRSHNRVLDILQLHAHFDLVVRDGFLVLFKLLGRDAVYFGPVSHRCHPGHFLRNQGRLQRLLRDFLG